MEEIVISIKYKGLSIKKAIVFQTKKVFKITLKAFNLIVGDKEFEPSCLWN